MASSIHFLADEDFNADIVTGLRLRWLDGDILTASEAGLLGIQDPDELVYAAEHGRILLTHDKRMMPDYFDAHPREGKHSPGVLYFRQLYPIGPAIEELLLIALASSPDEWRERFTYLPL